MAIRAGLQGAMYVIDLWSAHVRASLSITTPRHSRLAKCVWPSTYLVSPSGSELAVTRLQASKKASDWAERRKQALDRAHQIREQRIAEAKVRVVKLS